LWVVVGMARRAVGEVMVVMVRITVEMVGKGEEDEVVMGIAEGFVEDGVLDGDGDGEVESGQCAQ